MGAESRRSTLKHYIMKLFGMFVLALASAKKVKVDQFCGFDLHDTYKTDANKIEYIKQEKKQYENTEKPKRPANWRTVVRPKCVDNARRNFNKPGGYPDKKSIPVIKCTRMAQLVPTNSSQTDDDMENLKFWNSKITSAFKIVTLNPNIANSYWFTYVHTVPDFCPSCRMTYC